MIKLMIIGSLGKDAVAKEVSGKNVINFNVAQTEKWKDAQGNLKEKTTWVEAAWWTDKLAVLPYLTKGKQVFLEGSPEAGAYLKDGAAVGTLKLRVMQCQLIGGNAAGGQQQSTQAPPPPPAPVWNGKEWVIPGPGAALAAGGTPPPEDDNLPF